MIEIKKTVADPLPRIPFAEIADAVLGSRFELSLVVCGDTLARAMNKKYRHKTYKPNVLSFPLEKNAGEIFLNVRAAERESKKYDIGERDRLAHLFLHGCFHLKGLDHGRKMELAETRILKRFGFRTPVDWPHD